jgi:hypothetical protein
MSAILSFLGGTAFRWIFGEVVGFLKAKQEYAQELAMLRLQHDQDRDKNQWRIEEFKAAAAAGVQVIEAKSEAMQRELMDRAFLAATEATGRKTGIRWVDAWNASIRPGLATAAILLLVLQSVAPGYIVLTAFVQEVCGMALGIFVGGRIANKG